MVERPTTCAKGGGEQEEEQHKRREFEILARFQEHHFGQIYIEDCREEDWDLNQGCDPSEETQCHQQAAKEVSENDVVGHHGRGNPTGAHAIHQLKEVVAMHQIKNGFEEKTNPKVNSNEIPDDVGVRFNPEAKSSSIHKYLSLRDQS